MSAFSQAGTDMLSVTLPVLGSVPPSLLVGGLSSQELLNARQVQSYNAAVIGHGQRPALHQAFAALAKESGETGYAELWDAYVRCQ